MTRRSMAALCFTVLIIIVALLTSGCIDDDESVEGTTSIIQVTSISGATVDGVVTEITRELHVNGTTDIELESLDIKMEVPPSLGQAGSDISFGYNGSDPWSGGERKFSVIEPTRDRSDQIPLIVKGGDPIILRLDLSTSGVKLQTASTMPFEITWDDDMVARSNLYMPSVIPTDGTFRIRFTT